MAAAFPAAAAGTGASDRPLAAYPAGCNHSPGERAAKAAVTRYRGCFRRTLFNAQYKGCFRPTLFRAQ